MNYTMSSAKTGRNHCQTSYYIISEISGVRYCTRRLAACICCTYLYERFDEFNRELLDNQLNVYFLQSYGIIHS